MLENAVMALICTAMSKAKNHPFVARSSSVMKTAMGVLLTSAVLLLPTVRAEETSGDKMGERQGTQLSKGEIKAQQQFKMLDFNQDGKLSRKEVAIIPKLAAAFDETDTNKDGFVTYEEVRAFAVKYRAAREKAKAAEAVAAAPAKDDAHKSEADSAGPESK